MADEEETLAQWWQREKDAPRPRAPVLLRSLLPIPGPPRVGGGTASWSTEPQEPFRPLGLLIWGAPPGTLVEQILIGMGLQIVAGIGGIPAQWFATADSYEQVWKAHLEGKDPPGWGDFQILSIGMRLNINMSVEGPADWNRVQLLMWGHSIH